MFRGGHSHFSSDKGGSTSKLVILDRDGTLNITRPDYIRSPEQWQSVPGAMEAVARLNHAGWSTVVACNQAGLGRGLFDMATLNAVHRKLNEELAEHGGRLDGVFFCPHTPEDRCDCRKPLPGLYHEIGRRYGVDLAEVPAVGDTLLDLQAAHAAGCEPHLVRSGKAAQADDATIAQWVAQVPGTRVHEHLMAFAEFLISREREARAQEVERRQAGRHDEAQ